MSSSQEAASTLLINYDGPRSSGKELKEQIETGDISAKIDAMKKMIMMQLGGESQHHLIMSVIKFCVPQEDHILKKLLIYFWEVVEKTDASGKLLPEMILVCNFLRQDLLHPNEYVRGVTLRFLCKMKERDILEPLVSSLVQNLTHRVAYVRKNAVLAVHHVFTHFKQLLPDAPELIEKFLKEENDVCCKRNAFNSLFSCAPTRAIQYLNALREAEDLSMSGEVFQLAIVDVVRQLIQANPMDKGKHVPIIFSILQSKSSAVLYQCASTLLALTASPTALKYAASTFISILATHSDNNVRLIVLDRLDEMQARFNNILPESLMDILRSLSTGNIDIRRRIISLALRLVTPKNVEAFAQFMKKELVRSQSEDIGDRDAQQEYRQEIVKALHQTVMKHTAVAPSIVPIMLDYICEPGPSAFDVIVFIREVMHSHPTLRDEMVTKLVQQFQMISSPKVIRTVLWLFGVHCVSIEQIANVMEQVKQCMMPLPLTPPVQQVVSSGAAEAEGGISTVATTTVREDGTYVMSIQLVEKRYETERSDLTGMRNQIAGGDYFLAAALANTMAKLTVQLFRKSAPTSMKNTMQVECIDIIHELIRYGVSKDAPIPMDDDTHERIRMALTLIQNPHNEFIISIVDDSLSAFDSIRSTQDTGADGADVEEEVQLCPVDTVLNFSQLSRRKQSTLELEAVDDVRMAVSNTAVDDTVDPLARLQRVVQLSGLSDPVYAEATITSHQFDILIELLLINQNAETLQNVTVELSTIGDLKVCERSQAYTLLPFGSQAIRTNVKVCSTEAGVIFGTIVYDSPSTDRNCVILNEIRVDILDYIHPAMCAPQEFRNMWTAFEWENKVSLTRDNADMKQLVEHIMAQTNMAPIEPIPNDAECSFASISLYAKSVFGEDALANLSLERSEDGKIEGAVRIRSKTQGIALGLGDIVSMRQKKL